MRTYADKTSKNKIKPVSNASYKKVNASKPTFQFVDNRAGTVARGKLQESVNKSPRMMQLKAIEDITNGSPQIKQAAQLYSAADKYVPQAPVIQLNGKDKVKEQYKYLDGNEQNKYKQLAMDVKQELYKDSSLSLVESSKFSPKTEQGIMEMLSSIEGLHFGSNPELGEPWNELAQSYGGSKTGGALYSALRSPGFTKVLKTFDINWSSFAKAPEIHHLIYKKEEPQSAVAPWNLMLSTRGSSRGGNVVGQHEGMMHQVSSPQGRPNISQSVYLNQVPAVKGVVRRWGQGERPQVKMPNPLYKPAYDIFPQLGMGSNPLGSQFLNYQPPFNFSGPDLRTAERDNQFFSPFFSPFDDEHDHWSDSFEELMMSPQQEQVVQPWENGSFGSGFNFPTSFGSEPLEPLFPELDLFPYGQQYSNRLDEMDWGDDF